MKQLKFDDAGYTDLEAEFYYDEFEEIPCKICGNLTTAAYDLDGNFVGSSCCGATDDSEEE